MLGKRNNPDGPAARRPNVLFLLSDQERSWDWLPPSVQLPWRQRLQAEGLTLQNHWAHSSPCSPSRATIQTGLHVPQHDVPDNCGLPWQKSLDPGIATIGSVLRDAGYHSGYHGKWHVSYQATPEDMTSYGYSDWQGNDVHWMGLAGTGQRFDPIIADYAASWLRDNAATAEPWFMTVGLVNPHDVMWYPIDQPAYQAKNPQEVEFVRNILGQADLLPDDMEAVPAFELDYDDVVEKLPENFDDDLISKPASQRAWRWDQQHNLFGYIDPKDTKAWLRHLNYYVKLYELADQSMGKILQALEDSGAWDDTIIIFTSDHGDMCGSHGLRSKGPFIYDEIMRVPGVIRAPGVTSPGTSTTSLSSHVDLARTICGLAGVEPPASMNGKDLGPLLRSPQSAVRDHVLFCHATAHMTTVRNTRWSIRGYFDGRYKYARYFGIGGGLPNDDLSGEETTMLHGPNSAFEDHDHELYDVQEDPHELINLAHDRGRRAELRRHFEQMLSFEAEEML